MPFNVLLYFMDFNLIWLMSTKRILSFMLSIFIIKAIDTNLFPVAGGISKDELFGKFYAALDRSNFFLTSQGEVEDPAQVAKATSFFDDAYKVCLLICLIIKFLILAAYFINALHF